MLKQINKSLKKLLKPKGKINAKDIATMVLLVIVA